MSAVKDPNQKTTFIYSNFYHIYRKGKITKDFSEETSEPQNELTKGVVLKPAEVRVVNHEEHEGLNSWTRLEMKTGKRALAEQLHSLRDASKRLRFLMSEVDEILKKG